MTSQKHELKHINWIDIQMIYITAHSPIYYMTYDIYIYIYEYVVYFVYIFIYTYIFVVYIYFYCV